MRHFGWLGAVLVILIALIAGGVGFAIGASTTLPTSTTGTVGIVPGAWGWHGVGWGFPFFPFVGLLLAFLLVATLVAIGRRAAWAGPHGYGPHGWGAGPGGPADPRRAVFDDWHRRAHEQAPTTPWQEQRSGQPPDAQPPYGQPPYGQPPYGQQPSGNDPTSRR